jgi:hypothetical protein
MADEIIDNWSAVKLYHLLIIYLHIFKNHKIWGGTNTKKEIRIQQTIKLFIKQLIHEGLAE